MYVFAYMGLWMVYGILYLAPLSALAQLSIGDETAGTNVVTIENPLGETSLYDIAQGVLDILMVFAVPIILFFIVWAGFLYVTAAGNQNKITTASRALLYAVIGGVIVLGARLLLEIITTTISAFGIT